MYKGFIYRTAEYLYGRYGDEISSLCLIFPSRRASLFFADALASLADRPLWQPQTVSVDELMEQASGMKITGGVRLVTELYKVWSEYHNEPFDDFYFWGEMLLADFDSLDKYMVDARTLFSNLRDLKRIDGDHSYLTPEQRGLIDRFWESFGARESFSQEQLRFMKVWDTLHSVYAAYNERLRGQGMAYTGMVHRAASLAVSQGEAPAGMFARRYAVVGFNALTECEKELFDRLRGEAGALFFWDYDDYYVADAGGEAGVFMRSNLARYPMPADMEPSHDNFRNDKDIAAVSSPSDTLQCKYVHKFLSDMPHAPGKETAVVLCDEGLLDPLLYSIPENVEGINVTMGYPLRQSSAYSFVERLLELQRHRKAEYGAVSFHHADVTGLLRHPFLAAKNGAAALARRIADARMARCPADMLSGPGWEGVFVPAAGWRAMGGYLLDALSSAAFDPEDKLRAEMLNAAAENIRSLCNSLEGCGVDLSERVFASLLRRRLQSVRIPYEGEPLRGLQVMGFLETRALDFENVVILSVNDDILPGNRPASGSFIPHSLKLAYGIPGQAHHEAMYAYYFHRLLQRAGRVRLVYCSHTDERRSGEPSRYISQMEFESAHRLENLQVALGANLPARETISVEKDATVMRSLSRYLDPDSGRSLSPSALAAYVVCPLRFYYKYIASLRVAEDVSDDVDARAFGNLLHGAMETLYKPLAGLSDPRPEIRAMIGTPEVAAAVECAAAALRPSDPGATAADGGGNLQIASEMAAGYINRCILPFDASQGPFAIESTEASVRCRFPLPGGAAVSFEGKADRIDILEGGLRRVVDYKTASMAGSNPTLSTRFAGVEDLFTGKNRGATGAALQTMLYAMMLRLDRGLDARPSIYAVRHLRDKGYSPLLSDAAEGPVWSYGDFASSFEAGLEKALSSLFDPGTPLAQCPDDNQCVHCDYRTVCGRIPLTKKEG